MPICCHKGLDFGTFRTSFRTRDAQLVKKTNKNKKTIQILKIFKKPEKFPNLKHFWSQTFWITSTYTHKRFPPRLNFVTFKNTEYYFQSTDPYLLDISKMMNKNIENINTLGKKERNFKFKAASFLSTAFQYTNKYKNFHRTACATHPIKLPLSAWPGPSSPSCSSSDRHVRKQLHVGSSDGAPVFRIWPVQ